MNKMCNFGFQFEFEFEFKSIFEGLVLKIRNSLWNWVLLPVKGISYFLDSKLFFSTFSRSYIVIALILRMQ